MGRWDEINTWVGDGLRREAFYFGGDGATLYGSLYAAEPPSRRLGVAICNSWGIEADQAKRLVHPFALAAARGGGAGLVFDYPGCGDSGGDPETLTLEAMGTAAAAAVDEGRRRLPESEWALAGFMLGAAAAALAAAPARAGFLLLAQPELRPSEYFASLQRRARRVAALTRSGADTVYGYSPSTALLDSAARADAAVAAALAAYEGPGAVLRYSSPAVADEAPERFERIEVEGRRRFATQDDGKLGAAAARRLRRCMEEGG